MSEARGGAVHIILSGPVMTTAVDMVHEHSSADMPQIFRNPSLAPFVPLMTLRCSLMELENPGGDAASGVSDPTMPGCCG